MPLLSCAHKHPQRPSECSTSPVVVVFAVIDRATLIIQHTGALLQEMLLFMSEAACSLVQNWDKEATEVKCNGFCFRAALIPPSEAFFFFLSPDSGCNPGQSCLGFQV